MQPYYALALQTRCDAVNGCVDRAQAREQMAQAVVRIQREIVSSKAFVGADLKLVVLPEYFLTGFPMGEGIAGWREKACLAMDDSIYTALGELATCAGVFLAGNAYETDKHFPGLYFQCCFVIAPSGDIILRYRRLISMYAPTPHDVWREYLAHYGLEAVFPVVDTELGRLACVASEEILYPEIARMMALRGAEVLLHSTSEVGSPLQTPKHIAKQARALENMAYVISANSAGINGIGIPAQSTDGMSCVVDYRGQIVVQAGFGSSMVANAAIDIAALRAARRRPGMGNLLSRQRTELFSDSYAQLHAHPANSLIDPAVVDRDAFRRIQAETIARLIDQQRL